MRTATVPKFCGVCVRRYIQPQDCSKITTCRIKFYGFKKRRSLLSNYEKTRENDVLMCTVVYLLF